MAGYNVPYNRLVDPQHERKRTLAALRRSTTAFIILCIIAVVVAVGIIASLVVYLYFSSQFPGTDSSLPSTATSDFAQANSEDFAHILQRLNILEQEVETLKRRRGGSSLRHDKGHRSPVKSDKERLQPKSATKDQLIDQQTTQRSVTRVLQQLMSATSFIQSEYHFKSEEESLKSSQSSNQESTISLHQSSPTPSDSTAVGPSTILEGLAPPVDQQSSSLMKAVLLGGDLRRVARSRHNRKSTRKSWEDVTLSTEGPPLRDRGDRKGEGRQNTGSRDRSSKRRDNDENSCSPCTAATTFGPAAHFEGQRNGNVLITDADGWIREPHIWRYAGWMTQSDKDKFELSITQEVTVAEGGVYYIYSQILFYDNNYAVGQSICVNGRPLFTCTKSNISAEAKQSTCSLGGVARLPAEARLSIKLSVPNVRIALYADTSFFGLFKIAS